MVIKAAVVVPGVGFHFTVTVGVPALATMPPASDNACPFIASSAITPEGTLYGVLKESVTEHFSAPEVRSCVTAMSAVSPAAKERLLTIWSWVTRPEAVWTTPQADTAHVM
jgi:hypothetical protein